MSSARLHPYVICWLAVIITKTVGVSAQEAAGSITVLGKGTVKVAPTTVELAGTLSAEAELAGDALTRFRSTKDDALAAINKLGIENLAIEAGSFSVGPAGMQGNSTAQILLGRAQGDDQTPKVQVHETIRLRLSKIDSMDRDKVAETLVRIIDTAKEGGITFGPPVDSSRISIGREEAPSFVTFSIANPEAAREKAHADAIKDAQARAERIAKLSGASLLGIRKVSENSSRALAISSGLSRTAPPEQSYKLEEIEIVVLLDVEFGMKPL